MSLELLTTDEIYLSKGEYNATESKIQFQLVPVNPKKWTQIRNIPLGTVSSNVPQISYLTLRVPTQNLSSAQSAHFRNFRNFPNS